MLFLKRRIAQLIILLSFVHAIGLGATSTWTGSQDSNFDNPANWNNGLPTDIASFSGSGPTALSVGFNYSPGADGLTTKVNGLTFNPGAPAYTISVPGSGSGYFYLMFNGAGIVNNSSNIQTIHNNGGLTFFDYTANAGNATLINDNTTDGFELGYTVFYDSSSAGNATIINNVGVLEVTQQATLANATVSNTNGGVVFDNRAVAGSAVINNYADGGTTFYSSSSADHSTINTTSGTVVRFYDDSTAGNAHISDIGKVMFFSQSTAGNVTIQNSSGGQTLFTSSSTAGSSTLVDNIAGNTTFSDISSADHSAITNNSGGSTLFQNNATGANASLTNIQGATIFSENSNAGHSTILNTGGGTTSFHDASTAGNAAITNNGGSTAFFDQSTADHSSILNESGGDLLFNNSSTAGNATLSTVGTGVIQFRDASTAASAQISADLVGQISFLANANANNAAIINKNGGFTTFGDQASAGNSQISNMTGGHVDFFGNSAASNANIGNSTGSYAYFGDHSTAGNSTINNSGYVTFMNSSRAGTALMTNSGASLYFSDNTSADSATLVNLGGGSDYFYGFSSAGNATIQNTMGSVYFSSNSTAGYSTLINGNGSVISFLGNSTMGHGAIVNNAGGTVDVSGLNAPSISAGSISGAGSLILGNKNVIIGTNNQDANLSGVISGIGGSLTKIGSGTLALSGNNTYTGGTSLQGGVLAVSDDHNLGNLSGILSFDGGTLQTLTNVSLARSVMLNSAGGTINTGLTNSTLAGDIQGMGGFEKIGNGSLTLEGTNLYTGPTLIGAGVIKAGKSDTFSRSSAMVLANAPGVLLDLNNFDQGIGSLSGGGSSGGNVSLSSATLTTGFDNTDTTFSGVISGSGSLVKTGSGTFTLNGANTYTGGTVIDGGVLAIGGPDMARSAVRSQAAALGTGGNLLLNSGVLKSANSSFSAIQVPGDYLQTGGVLDLRIGGGINLGHYDQLVVGGAAHLGGILQLDLTGGSFLPGAGQTYAVVQSTSITGSFAGSNGPAGLGISFNQDLEGLKVILTQNDFAPFALTNNQHVVGSAIDQFSKTVQGDLGALVGALNTLQAGQIPSALNELSPQRYEMYSDVAFRSAAFTTQGLSGHLGRLRSGVTGLDMAGMISHPAASETLLADAAVGRSQEAWDFPTDGLDGDPTLASASKSPSSQGDSIVSISPNLSAFVSGNVLFANQRSTQDLQKSNFTTAGTMGGLDYRWNDQLVTGALLSYTHTTMDLDDEGSTAKVQGYAPGLYAAYFYEQFYVNGLLSYGLNSYDANRNVVFGGFNRSAQSATHGHQFLSDLNTGTNYNLGSWILGPSLGLSYVKLKVNGFTENGSDGADLLVSDLQSDSLRTRFGGQIERPFKWGQTPWTSGAHLAWQHEYLDNSQSITAGFNELSSGTFTVQTTAPQRDSALFGIGLSAHLTKALTLSIDYDAQAGQSNFFAQSIRGGGSLRF